MEPPFIYEALADAFVGEGVDAQFVLLGDGNMHWSTALRQRPGVATYHVRHEHTAVTAAMGYAEMTGTVGVASVTCGPGLTQIMTALTSAVRCRSPIVVFAGEIPLSAKWYNQAIEQQPFVAACGARYISAHAPARMLDNVREAFYLARTERAPVVLGIPYDLQKERLSQIESYVPSTDMIQPASPILPDQRKLDEIVELITAARRPVFLAGRGAIQAEAGKIIERIADHCGGLLTTTLLARGLFDDNPYSLGICGGFSREASRRLISESDLVVAFGASLNNYTQHGGRIFGEALIVQIDREPKSMRDGLRTGHVKLQADARLAAEQILERLSGVQSKAGRRSPELLAQLRDEPADSTGYDMEGKSLLDPRSFVEALEPVLPPHYEVVSGSGHQGYFHTTMRGCEPGRYHAFRDFGAVGNALGHAIGVAASRKDGGVVLFEGDGGLLMHIQELETISRHGLKLLVICLNDGAYGAEIHRLRADGLDDSGAIFGRPDFAAIARSFNLGGATVTSLDGIAALMEEYVRSETAMVWDVHISDRVVSPLMRARVKAH